MATEPFEGDVGDVLAGFRIGIERDLGAIEVQRALGQQLQSHQLLANRLIGAAEHREEALPRIGVDRAGPPERGHEFGDP